MSMPFRLAVSEKPETILPVAGQIQPRFSSSISGTRPVSARGGDAGGAVLCGAGVGAALCGAGVGAAATFGSGGALAAAGAGIGECCCIWVSACSVYGTLIARGSVLNVA